MKYHLFSSSLKHLAMPGSWSELSDERICPPSSFGPRAVDYIIDHAEIDIVFVQDKKVKELLSSECTLAKRLKLLVCFSSLQQEEKDRAVSMNIKHYSWNEFLNMLICTVTSASSNMEETHNTLKFASRAKLVEIYASRNKIIDEKSLIKKYQREISCLKLELDQLRKGMLVGVNHEELLTLKQQRTVLLQKWQILHLLFLLKRRCNRLKISLPRRESTPQLKMKIAMAKKIPRRKKMVFRKGEVGEDESSDEDLT